MQLPRDDVAIAVLCASWGHEKVADRQQMDRMNVFSLAIFKNGHRNLAAVVHAPLQNWIVPKRFRIVACPEYSRLWSINFCRRSQEGTVRP
jgi:hypothetical protein